MLHMILLEVKVAIMVMVGVVIQVGRKYNQSDHDERNNLYCKICDRWGHEANTCCTPWEKIKERNKKWEQDKRWNYDSAHYVTTYYNNIIENLCNTLFASWEDAWLLDTGATCHMKIRREFFEEINTNIDGVVYFANKSCIKPLGIGTMRLKFLVLLSLVLIQK